MKLLLTLVSLLIISLSPVAPAMADDDHVEARRLREAGDVLPLPDLLESVRARYPGTVIEVELERKHDRIVYEIEILGDDGTVSEIRVDARNGEILSAEEDH